MTSQSLILPSSPPVASVLPSRPNAMPVLPSAKMSVAATTG
ncbi:hypothetical protein [Streptomyces sp. NRRL F-5650]|nr:hypothetical protein [Streptomyces sp. NRRL F-5650]